MGDQDDAVLALGITTGVLTLVLMCCCYCRCKRPTDAHRRHGEDRRRTLAANASFVARATEPTADLAPRLRHRAYFRRSTRGDALFCQEFMPADAAVVWDDAREAHVPSTAADAPPHAGLRGIVLFCHGYLDATAIFPTNTMRRLADAGFGVFSIDYEGHGMSDGLHGYWRDGLQAVVSDTEEHFDEVRSRFPGMPTFLYGESLGGAVALFLHRRQPATYTGALLVAPMTKIADEMKPAPIVISALIALSRRMPTLAAVPSGADLLDKAFKDPKALAIAKENPIVYDDRTRLATGRELFHNSLDCEAHLADVTMPFLLMHGEADVVTAHEVSEALQEQARSKDKTFKSYPGMWHALSCGETEENMRIVFKDMTDWLLAHSEPATTATPAPSAAAASASRIAVDVGSTTDVLGAAAGAGAAAGEAP